MEGVSNIILQDRSTGERYALRVEGGTLTLLSVGGSLEATVMTLVDGATGAAYSLVVDKGELILEEVS